jgi:hypothetical protein
MRWKIPETLSAMEADVARRLRRRSHFFVFLREIRHLLFTDAFQDELASAYAPRGQEPVAPALLAMATLLQAYTGVSDAEAVEAAEMDRRWQLVLGTLGTEGAPFGQGSLVRFRARLVAKGLDQRLLDRTVELAKETGGFGWKKLRVALDSSPLRGAGRVEDGWNLIGHAMRSLVSILARLASKEEERIIEESGANLLSAPSLKAALDIDWDDRAARHEALGVVVQQAHQLIGWAHRELPRVMSDAQVSDAVELLEALIEQNTEPDPDDPSTTRIREGVPPGRICSAGDVEMRHGRKSQSKAFNGYKRHVAVLVDAPLILSAHVLPANQPENEAVPKLLDECARHGQLEELFIDRGYVAHERVASLHRAAVPIRCRPWPENNRTGLFQKSKFAIDLEARTVTCPGNHTVPFSGATRRATFGIERCGSCELREQCTTSKTGRALDVHPQEELLAELRANSRDAAGRKRLRFRVAVEHRLARVQGTQTGRARYKGVRMNTFDLRRHAAVANILEIRHALAA